MTSQPPQSFIAPGTGPEVRSRGIALLVVMVVFVVLYLVVYQLHFSTTMEQYVARARFSDVESKVAMQSAALFVITLLIEDLKEDLSGASSGAGAEGMGGDRKDSGRGPAGAAPGQGEAGGTFSRIDAGGGGGSKWYDSLHENIFNSTQKQLGQSTIKITIRDGEGRFDLNRLFGYARLEEEEIVDGMQDIREEDLLASVDGKSTEEAGMSLRETMLSKSKSRARTEKAAGATRDGGDAAFGGTGIGGETAEEDPAAAALSEYEEEEWTPPGPESIAATERVLERAILKMFSVNEFGYGYRYSRKYDAATLARDIVQYVLDRKQMPHQARIYLLTELLNIPGVTPEVYYGPVPRLVQGEEFPVGDGFILRYDEFGDAVPEWTFGMDPAAEEEEARVLQELQSHFGQFADLGGQGLGRLSENPLTRGMKELPVTTDHEGSEYVVEVPRAIGLKDLFTTFSTGKININTASVPVLFGLLHSLSEEEADFVAQSIGVYRNRFQEEVDEEGVQDVTSGKETPDLGQPKRRAKRTEEEAAASTSPGSTELDSTLSSMGIDPTLASTLGSSYQELETNYFTSLEQLELVDGTTGGPEDRLRRDEGVERVSEEDDSLFRRTINDLEKSVVFGSTYFTAELKGKSRESRSVKTAHLTVRRDYKSRLVEVLMWKNSER
ncbi:MAG TPA: hypothetical protein VMT52_03840 [Planctomycetota bacterium]|nr:hypothetical protein [Planctomycetota bacterium]